jgi:NADPH:quinone reductase-like Zn-dependent oxidoreductase
MKAIVHERYGGPEVLELRDVPRPELTDDGVLVRVRAASINKSDWYGVAGRPWVARPVMGIRRPKDCAVGGDFAGVVETVGKDVTDFAAGDEVFGVRSGALAEYVNVVTAVAAKPSTLSFEEAASLGIAGLTALQGLRDKGGLQPGEKVLVNGASGGVGTFAVQIAKALGGEVTAVCSTPNVERARELGADRVIDYTREDFTKTGERYDLILDVAGSRSWRATKRVLAPRGRLVIVGAPTGTRLLGPLSHIIRVKLAAIGSKHKVVFFIAKLNRADLATLRELSEAGKLKPVIDRRYELADAADAFRHLGGHARGKVVLTV